MKRTQWSTSLVAGFATILLAGLCLFPGCSSDRPATVTFDFNPPDSLRYTGTVVADRVVDRGDTVVVDSTFMTSSHLLVKEGDFYLLHSVTESLKLTRNGHPFEDPLTDLYTGVTFTHRLDSTGTSLELTGFQTILDNAQATLPEETAREIRSRMSPDLQSQREVAEWNGRVGRFYGKTMAVGDVIYDSTIISLSQGATVTQFRAIVLDDTTTVDGELCAKLKVVANTDPAVLANQIGKTPDELYQQFGVDDERKEQIASMPLTSSLVSEWVLEVGTMLIHSETIRRDSYASAGTIELSTRETRIKKYTY